MLGSFSLFFGDTVGPRYTAPKISAISYLFRTFSLLIMGDTERPRYTGFRGISVRGITALQCTLYLKCWLQFHYYGQLFSSDINANT